MRYGIKINGKWHHYISVLTCGGRTSFWLKIDADGPIPKKEAKR